MFNSEILERLKIDLGLNLYEAKLWLALISKGMASAAELSQLSGVPRSRCYDILESLEKKGFVIPKIEKPIKYIAVSPKEVIERLKKAIGENTKKKITLFKEFENSPIFKDLELLYNSGINLIDPYRVSLSLNGKKYVYRFMRKMILNAKRCIKISATEEDIEKKIRLMKNILVEKLRNGVDVKIAAPINKKLKNLRIIKTNFNIRFVLVDSLESLLILNEDIDNESAIWIKSNFLTRSLENIFELGIKA